MAETSPEKFGQDFNSLLQFQIFLFTEKLFAKRNKDFKSLFKVH
ncbi:hypothetical protein EDC91_13536 [Shewanella fodinae]|uniref:Uncharacterized protein n=1 Tax=Shewanella fodinae TaxID=552357 RepID=A0A4R2F3T5_9GAMM|nr:hypothetical protein EDC91_13536 [Shewanella fodinae]